MFESATSMECPGFHEWFSEQDQKENIIGLASRWFYGKRRGKSGDLGSKYDDWKKVAKLAPLSIRESVEYGLKEAWESFASQLNESNHGRFRVIDGEGNQYNQHRVHSTIHRLTRMFKVDGLWGPPIETAEVIDVCRFDGPVAKVGSSAGLTVNLGNWESARIDSWVEFPCYPEEAKGMSFFASRFVSDRIDEALDDLLGVKANPRVLEEIAESGSEKFEPVRKVFKAKEGVLDKDVESDDEMEEVVGDSVDDNSEPSIGVIYEPPIEDDDDILF
jgi:hypothetical protein